jgi:hypothetical protein
MAHLVPTLAVFAHGGYAAAVTFFRLLPTFYFHLSRSCLGGASFRQFYCKQVLLASRIVKFYYKMKTVASQLF